MTIIEGVGDEVLNFFIIVGTLLIGWLAWCSTNIADQPLIRTVLILQHRTRNRIAALRANQPQQNSTTENSENDIRQSDGSGNGIDINCPESSLPATSHFSGNNTNATTTNEEVLIRAMDSFNSDETSLLPQDDKVEEVENTSTEIENRVETETTTSNITTSVNTTAAAIETTTETATVETVSSETSLETEARVNESGNDENKISIKLKFINDDQKLVAGDLKEPLGDFKKRHFQLELEARKLVRLVFNGQVLQPETRTLEQCGFFNNCVVHCLIHQPRPATVGSNNSTIDSSSRLYFNPQTFQNIQPNPGYYTEWDLGRLLVSVVTLMLGLAWYFRYHYAQLFTVTTTAGLFGLTAIFTVTIFGHLFPDSQDSLRNIE